MTRLSTALLSIVVSALLVTAGCSKNEALEYRYRAEELFHEANRMARDAGIKRELNAPGTEQQVADAFERTLSYCYTALDNVDSAASPQEYLDLSNLTYHSTIRLSQFLFGDKQLDSCIALYQRLNGVSGLTGYQQMYASLNLGQVLQSAGQWDSAVTVYVETYNDYYPPVSPEGEVEFKLFNLPAHIFQIFERIGDTSAAFESFLVAETYYRDLTRDFPDSEVARAARTNLASLYEMVGRPEAAIGELRALTDTAGNVTVPAQLQIADILAGRLKQYREALELYDQIDAELSGRDTGFAPIIMYQRSLVLLELDRYADAREELIELADSHRRYYQQNATAQLVKARSFDLEGNWPRAETEYRYLMENYAGSDEAMSTYLYLERHFREANRNAEANRWYERAIEHFDELIAGGGNTAGRALMHKAELYRQRQLWPEAAQTLEELYRRFPNTRLGRSALITASEVHRQRLDQPAVADSLIEVYKRAMTDPEQTAAAN
ncbi:tetratricopeptide repeat protein [candidate division GN15 bacterium]|nr:tetratricopeptide repeat protein [candidate division GN15 bacterium]